MGGNRTKTLYSEALKTLVEEPCPHMAANQALKDRVPGPSPRGRVNTTWRP